MKEKTQIWVDPSFKRKLKRQAVEEDLDILSLTKKLGEIGKPLKNEKVKSKKQKSNFDFRF